MYVLNICILGAGGVGSGGNGSGAFGGGGSSINQAQTGGKI